MSQRRSIRGLVFERPIRHAVMAMREVCAALALAGVVALGCSGDDDRVPGTAGAGGLAGAGGAGYAGSEPAGGAAGALGEGGAGGQAWEPVDTDWCTGEWIGLDEQTCFYRPTQPDQPVGLFVFLHGMMPPDSLPTTMQSMVRQAADDYGFVALFPRGRAGLCGWDSSVEDWWCWPTSREAVDDQAADLVSEWDDAELLLESILGLSFSEHYVLGFSNGGYFASYVGLEELWTTDGAGLVAAGRSFVDESLLSSWQPPFYIAVGELDQASVQQSAENLAWVLHLNDWPHQYVLHSNRGHELGQDDFDTAWSLWTQP